MYVLYCPPFQLAVCRLPADLTLGVAGGTIRLEPLIELKSLNSSLSSSNFSIRAFRAYPLIEIRQTAPCRAIRGKSSDSRQQYLSQQYPPPLLKMLPEISSERKTNSGILMSVRQDGQLRHLLELSVCLELMLDKVSMMNDEVIALRVDYI